MKILVMFPKTDLSGASRVGLGYVSEMLSRGHSVSAIVDNRHGDSTPVTAELKKIGVDSVQTLRLSVLNFVNIARVVKHENVKERIQLVVSLFQEDLKLASGLSVLFKIQHLSVKQSLRNFHGHTITKYFKEKIYKLFTNQCCDVITCVSSSVFAEQKERFGVPSHKLHTIHNGIDIGNKDDQNSLSQEQINLFETARHVGSNVIVSVGRISTQKGFDLLISAVGQLHAEKYEKNFSLIFVGEPPGGEGEYMNELVALAKHFQIEDRVFFVGWQDNPRALMANATFCVQPSRWEGLPLTVIEALYENGICIYSDCTSLDLTEFSDNRGLIIHRKNDVASLQEKLKQVSQISKIEKQHMSRKAQVLVEMHYNSEESNSKFGRLIDTLEIGSK